MQSTIPEPGYTIPSAAKLLGYHPKAIYPVVARGDIEVFEAPDGRLMVSENELYAFKKAHPEPPRRGRPKKK